MIAYVDTSVVLALYVNEDSSQADHRILEASTGVIDTAIEIAASTGVKSLDAIHISSAQVALGSGAVFVTFDRRQAVAARSLGMTVLGVN